MENKFTTSNEDCVSGNVPKKQREHVKQNIQDKQNIGYLCKEINYNGFSEKCADYI